MVCMRLLLFIFLTCKALMAEDYTIQLMSYKNDSSLTPYFLKMVKKTGLPSQLFEEDGLKKIAVGVFHSKAEAQRVCKTLKCIPHDVFVRVLPQKKVEEKVQVSENNTSEKSDVVCPKCPTMEPCSAFKDHSTQRACEIGNALDYLRNSGYYRFSAEGNLGLSKHSR
jgi:hypothetical protein